MSFLKSRKILLALLITGVLLPEAAQAFRMWQTSAIGRTSVVRGVKCDDRGGFAHWENHQIDWELSSTSVTAARAGALTRAAASWSAVSASDYLLTNVGTGPGGFGTDQRNTVVWAAGNGCTGNCLAITAIVVQAGQVIVESDISVNNTVAWSTDGSTPNDIEAMLLHELGHSLGIDHSEVNTLPTPVMNLFHQGTAGRALTTDDQAALWCSVGRYGPGGSGTKIRYRAHVRGRGWLEWVQNGATAGTTGQSRRMEAAEIEIADGPIGMGVCYKAYVQGRGWLETECDGDTGGTTEEGRRMEAIRIYLTNFPEGCGIRYRAHVAGKGWMGWVHHNQTAGTLGKRMEALQVRLIGTCG